MVDGVSTRAAEEPGPTVQSLRMRTLLVGPLRLALSVIFLIAARLAGSPTKPSLLGYAVGAVVILVIVFNDPRARFRKESEAQELPSNVRVAPPWMHAAHAAFPSTLGVAALALVALFGRPTLAAVLAGILAGLGVAALLAIHRVDPA